MSVIWGRKFVLLATEPYDTRPYNVLAIGFWAIGSECLLVVLKFLQVELLVYPKGPGGSAN